MEELIKISQNAHISEDQALKNLAPYLDVFKSKDKQIRDKAKIHLERIKAKNFGLTQKMLAAYPIKSASGRAIMSLAECLLRVPDKETAYALIDDKIKNIDWKPHTGRTALNLVLETALKTASKMGANLLVYKSLKTAFKSLGDEFVLAEDIKQAVKAAKSLKKEGYLLSYDMLGEGARNKDQAANYLKSYLQAIELAEEGDSVSVKISALHPKYELIKINQLEAELLTALRQIIAAAKAKKLLLIIDAEEARRLDISLILFAKLYAEFSYDKLGLAVQAYNKRALEVLRFLAGLGNVRIPVRLVKGAYWDAEIKKAQELGLPNFPVYTAKQNTDLAYLACAKFLLDNNQKFFPQFATHNLLTILSIEEVAAGKHYEYQKLFGMGDEVYDVLKPALKAKVRVYAPVGGHEDLLSYLIRRLLENGSNSSFVNQIASKDIQQILRSPFSGVQYANADLPLEIFKNRKNSSGYELGNLAHLEAIKLGLNAAEYKEKSFTDASAVDCEKAINKANSIFEKWNDLGVTERAKILEKAADLLEQATPLFLKAIMTEGKKTLPDAINELREAVDFCRYYAIQAQKIMQPRKMAGITGEENIYSLQGRGVFVCISPWNFPLAIFIGQVAAALVSGNCVIAKPAEQTPNIAALAVDILHKAGVPENALILLTGKGEVVGKALTESPNISGVCFTGGTDTAKHIQKAILQNPQIIPLIAETGGQNAMIVDSSALLEQALDDIITSAFGSSGQRCSALRVLFVQDDIANKLLEMLKSASLELEQSANLSADLKGIIDAESEAKILEHTQKYGQNNLPAIIEIPSISALEKEVFGPVLHIVRFKKLDDVIAQVNSTGYALTFGVHTRIQSRAEYLAKKIRAGNVYINRSMIGAVVESQPFGGFGLSGTGFKAGGPNYLLRFCNEKVVTTNKTATGGNLDIL